MPADEGPKGERSQQLDFPFMAKLDERAKLELLIHKFADGAISVEELGKRVEAQYHLNLGAVLRAFRAIDPAAARLVAQRLQLDLSKIAGTPEETAAPSSKSADEGPDLTASAKSKSESSLVREFAILTLLRRSDGGFTASEVSAAVRTVDKHVSEAAITALLDRLRRANLIGRPRKGFYTSSPSTEPYLREVVDEIRRRDLKVPGNPAI